MGISAHKPVAESGRFQEARRAEISLPEVVVVIPCVNEAQSTATCIDAALAAFASERIDDAIVLFDSRLDARLRVPAIMRCRWQARLWRDRTVSSAIGGRAMSSSWATGTNAT